MKRNFTKDKETMVGLDKNGKNAAKNIFLISLKVDLFLIIM